MESRKVQVQTESWILPLNLEQRQGNNGDGVPPSLWRRKTKNPAMGLPQAGHALTQRASKSSACSTISPMPMTCPFIMALHEMTIGP